MDVNMGIAVAKGISTEERKMVRALPEFTAPAITSRKQAGVELPRVPVVVPMKAPPVNVKEKDALMMRSGIPIPLRLLSRNHHHPTFSMVLRHRHYL